MKALVIYSHTYPETSVAGKAILEVLEVTPGFEVRNIDALYPDLNKIDIAAEQQALLEADVIIFQHPVFWYSGTSALKRWMDEVLQFGFAYGDGGDKLHGKKFIHSFTVGSEAAAYVGELERVICAPFEATANYCGMEYVQAFPLYGQFPPTNPNVAQEAKAHAEKLVAFVHSL
jgi:glutathione-regulated potassium-efflux system ancillary protein kefF